MVKSFAAQRSQFAVEAVPGVPGTPDRALASGTIEIKGTTETGRVEKGGQMWASRLYEKHSSSEGTIESVADFSDLRALLTLAFGFPQSSEQTPGVNECIYTLKTTRPTWTVVYGDNDHAARAAGLGSTSFALDLGAQSGDAKVSIGLAGGPFEDGATLAETVDEPEANPVSATDFRVYVDPSAETIGTTPLPQVLSAKFELGDLQQLVRFLANETATTSTRPKAQLSLVAVAGTRVRELRSVRNVHFVRIVVEGPALSGTEVKARLQLDLAVQTSAESRGEQEAVYASTLAMDVVGAIEPTVTLVTDAVA